MLKSLILDFFTIIVVALVSTATYYLLTAFVAWNLDPNWEKIRIVFVASVIFWALISLFITVGNVQRPK